MRFDIESFMKVGVVIGPSMEDVTKILKQLTDAEEQRILGLDLQTRVSL